jgi:Holliday junction resolvase-like predicted endonuclease
LFSNACPPEAWRRRDSSPNLKNKSPGKTGAAGVPVRNLHRVLRNQQYPNSTDFPRRNPWKRGIGGEESNNTPTLRTNRRKPNKLDQYGDFLVHSIEEYCERVHPNWRIEAFLGLLETSVRILRDHIESPKALQITWQSPWVTWPYPVDWDWAAWKRRDKVGAGFRYEQLTLANTRTRKTALQTMAKILVQYLTYGTLQSFTAGVGFEKRRNRYTPILSPETAHALSEISGRRARSEVLKMLFQPFSMGAAPIQIDENLLKKGGKIPRKLAKELHEACTLIDLPSIDLTANIDGNVLKLSLILQIHPLVVDADIRKAHYPITVGFVIVPGETADIGDLAVLLSQSWLNPGNWDSNDQGQLWSTLLVGLKRMREKFAKPGDVQIADATLTISAKVKIRASESDTATLNVVMEKMLKSFQATGEVIELNYQFGESAPQISTGTRLRYVELLGNVERATTADSKGRALEELVATLFANVPGFQIKQRVRTETEEIDLIVLNAGEDTRWKADAPLILVECKNWSSNCGKDELVVFKEKLANRRGRSSLGFLISWNGFARTVTKELLRGSREDALIVLLSGERIRAAAHSGILLPTLQAAWDEAVMT